MDQPKSGTPGGRQGPQGTQFFSKADLDRLLAEAVTEPPKGAPVSLRGASESVAGRVFALEQPRVLIGRGANCDIVIQDSSISSEHARFTNGPNGWVVTNLLSTNGTFVNGKRATTVPLCHKDHVRIGRIEFVFEMPDGPSSALPSRGPSSRRWLLLAAAIIVLTAAAVGGWLL